MKKNCPVPRNLHAKQSVSKLRIVRSIHATASVAIKIVPHVIKFAGNLYPAVNTNVNLFATKAHVIRANNSRKFTADVAKQRKWFRVVENVQPVWSAWNLVEFPQNVTIIINTVVTKMSVHHVHNLADY